MDNFVGGLIGLAAIVATLLVVVFAWVMLRQAWYWSAAKMFGWSEAEKFERETAWVEREATKAERVAKRDELAFRDTDRRRIGAFIVAAAVGSLAYQLNLPWWHSAAIVVAIYVGMTMAAGLSFKW